MLSQKVVCEAVFNNPVAAALNLDSCHKSELNYPYICYHNSHEISHNYTWAAKRIHEEKATAICIANAPQDWPSGACNPNLKTWNIAETVTQ